jgi:hypothetical protein
MPRKRLNNGYLWVEIESYRPGAVRFGYSPPWFYPLHRLVAEQKYGCDIAPGENVHHLDGNRLNNDPSNVVIVSHAEHQRIHCGTRDGTFCLKCRIELYNDDGGAKGLCRGCYKKAHNRAYYQKHREKYLAYQKRRREAR